MSRVAMMQGRLYPPSPDRYQVFPSDRWREELDAALSFGYDGLELLVDREGVCLELAERGELRAYAGRFPSACLDALAHVGAVGSASFAEALRRALSLCEALDVGAIVIPLVEANRPADPRALRRDVETMLPALGEAARRCAIECDLPAETVADVLSCFDLALCYDTGNARFFGRHPERELLGLEGAIGHVHVKDRNVGGPNVPFGTGDVDFASVGDALRRIGYVGTVGLETAYGTDALESGRMNRIRVKETLGI